MTKEALNALTDEGLVEKFAQYAHEWGEACAAGNTSRAGKMVFRLRDLSNELKSRGPAARMKLAPLMVSMDPGTRYYAAHHLLALLPEQSRAAITSVWDAGLYGISGTAGMTLGNLEDGTFTPT